MLTFHIENESVLPRNTVQFCGRVVAVYVFVAEEEEVNLPFKYTSIEGA